MPEKNLLPRLRLRLLGNVSWQKFHRRSRGKEKTRKEREHLGVVFCALYSGVTRGRLQQMMEVQRRINGYFLVRSIVFLVHGCRKLAILNSPRKVLAERGGGGKVLKPLSSRNAKGEALVPGTSTPSAGNSHTATRRLGKNRPEKPGVIDWTNVSSYFNLEIASSIKVWGWWGWIVTDFRDKSRIIYILHRSLLRWSDSRIDKHSQPHGKKWVQSTTSTGIPTDGSG